MNRIALMEISEKDNKDEIKSQHIQIVMLFSSLIVLIVILSATFITFISKNNC